MSEQLRQIIESKRAYRSKLAALPFAEKIILLEKLRGRSLAIGASRGNGIGTGR
jgi:hypothetical protein